jgi:hypothetical protein
MMRVVVRILICPFPCRSKDSKFRFVLFEDCLSGLCEHTNTHTRIHTRTHTHAHTRATTYTARKQNSRYVRTHPSTQNKVGTNAKQQQEARKGQGSKPEAGERTGKLTSELVGSSHLSPLSQINPDVLFVHGMQALGAGGSANEREAVRLLQAAASQGT